MSESDLVREVVEALSALDLVEEAGRDDPEAHACGLATARGALRRIEADLRGPERSEGPYVARSTQALESAARDTLHTTPANDSVSSPDAPAGASEGAAGEQGAEG